MHINWPTNNGEFKMQNRREFIASSLATGTLATGIIGLSPLYTPALARNVVRPVNVPRKYRPKRIWHFKGIPAGEVHLFPNSFKMLWTMPGGRAIEYTAGIGRKGLYEPGTFFVGAKKEWPGWTPTKDMIKRQPKLYSKYRDGMPGGINNPLGARALYLFTKERGDTFLRLHGTNNPRTIGKAVSNGCARLVNPHIVDLYNRVPIGTKVVLHRKRRG